MTKKSLMVLLVSCLMVFASCSDDEGPSDEPEIDSGTAGTGGGTGGGDDSAVADSGGNGGDTGGTSGSGGSATGCPDGYLCTAPAGEFVCTEAQTLQPPLCAKDSDCELGKCTQYQGQGYCIKNCGPEKVTECPEDSVCNGLVTGASICAQSIDWSAPPCSEESPCPFGECLPSYTGNLCILPCEATIIETCPTGTACAPIAEKFYCADPETGTPDKCSADNKKCDYGTCVKYGFTEDYYCTQECAPPTVDACEDGSVCRTFLSFGYLCSEKDTAVPPECEKDADCSYGKCIKSITEENKSYCVEYCSLGSNEILGSVVGLDGALGGVDVCVFEDGKANEDLCTTTNDSGEFALFNLPDKGFFVLSMSKEGYQSNLQIAYTNTSLLGILSLGLMFTTDEIADAFDAVDVTPEDDTGSIVFMVLGTTGALSEYTVEISPEEGSGPFYSDADGKLDKSLEASSASGWGTFLNLPAGDYDLSFTATGLTCTPPPTVMVEKGYLSYIVTTCF
jgi:hypothetical protein